MTTRTTFAIVCVRVEEKVEAVPGTGRPDLGIAPRLRSRKVASAAVWLNEGTESDLVKATDWATREGWVAMAVPDKVSDPLAWAKATALRAA